MVIVSPTMVENFYVIDIMKPAHEGAMVEDREALWWVVLERLPMSKQAQRGIFKNLIDYK